MNPKTNDTYRMIDDLLTDDLNNPYIQFTTSNKSSSKMWRSQVKPSTVQRYMLFNLLESKVKEWAYTHPCLTLKDFDERITLLERIHCRADELKTKYVNEQDSSLKQLFSVVTFSYPSNREGFKKKTLIYHQIFSKTVSQIIATTAKQEAAAKKRYELVRIMEEIPEESLSQLLKDCALAFEMATSEGNEYWTNEHRELLSFFFNRVHNIALNGELSIEEIAYIASAAEKCTDILGDEFVWVTFKLAGTKETCKINALKFAVHSNKLDDLFRTIPYDKKHNSFEMNNGAFEMIRLICQHIDQGYIENLSGFSHPKILTLFSCTYFQNSIEFMEKCFEIFNRKFKEKIRFKYENHGISATLSDHDCEGNPVLIDPFIRNKITELNLKCFSACRPDIIEQPEKLFNYLLKQFPQLSKLTLPLPSVLTKQEIQKLTKLQSLKRIHFNLSECSNIDQFLATAELAKLYNNENWQISLDHMEHLPTRDAIQIHSFFPRSRTISLDEKEDLTDIELVMLCEKLKYIDRLSLKNCRSITDKGIKATEKHSGNLKKIGLYGCENITDNSLIPLITARGENLLYLDIGATAATNNTARCIAKQNTKLLSLCLSDCTNINDLGVYEIIRHCPEMRFLYLDNLDISDATILSIASKMPEISLLNLYGNEKISAHPLKTLFEKCSHLTKVDIRETGVSSEELEEFRISYPRITFVWPK